MAAYPTDKGSPGTWGAECRAYHAVSTDLATGKIKNEALQVASTAPIADAALANKKYVDDGVSVDGVAGASWGAASESHTDSSGLITKIGSVSVTGNGALDVTYAIPFPTNATWVNCSYTSTDPSLDNPCGVIRKVGSENTKLTLTNGDASSKAISWIAKGY